MSYVKGIHQTAQNMTRQKKNQENESTEPFENRQTSDDFTTSKKKFFFRKSYAAGKCFFLRY